jgi:hypothetical protein
MKSKKSFIEIKIIRLRSTIIFYGGENKSKIIDNQRKKRADILSV